FERHTAWPETAMVEENLGGLAEVTGEGSAAAAAHYRRASNAYQHAGNRHGVINIEYNLLRLDDRAAGDFFPRIEAARKDAAAIGDPTLEGAILHLWGDIQFGNGDYDGAIAKLEDAVAAMSSVPLSTELGTTYTSLGRIYRLHGQVATALQYQL